MKLIVGKEYDVVVKEVLPKVGAVVLFEDDSTALIHISNISNEYVDDVRNFVRENGSYMARCQEGKYKPVELSLKHLDLKNQHLVERPRKTNSDKSNHTKTKSVEDMIDESNKVLEDKFKNRNKKGHKKFRK